MLPESKSWLLACAVLLGWVVLLALPGKSPAASPSGAASASDVGSQAQSAALRGSVLRLVNRQRVKRGLRRLRRSGSLSDAARWQSSDMVERGYFDHERPGGPSLVQRIRKTGYLSGARSWIVGENLAWGQGGRSTPKSIVAAWMASAGHRANILDRRYRQIGIGLVLRTPGGAGASSGGAVTVTTDFGARR